MRNRKYRQKEADLDITSFMNLMIILVPVLLMSMVFSHVTVLDLKLPDLNANSQPNTDPAKENLELVIRPDRFEVYYPSGSPVTGENGIVKIEDAETGEQVYDFEQLHLVLQDIKKSFQSNKIEKDDILILSEPDIDYQTIVKSMDTVRSFDAVVAASLVKAELFPVISLGDAPLDPRKTASQAAGGAQ